MIYRFDQFQVDDADFRLTRGGEPIALEPKALRLLLYLIQNRNRLVRKQEILENVWQEANVTDSVLTRSIGLLRKALNDDSREPRFIQTVPTAGYRFIADVISSGGVPASAAVLTVVPKADPQTDAQTASPQSPPPVVGRRFASAAVLVGCLLLLVSVVAWSVEKRLRAERPIRSLAVLPLENLSGDPNQDYFADGTTDELITELARIPGLRVVSRTSVMQDKGAHKSLQQIAGELNVDAIVEGSVVRSGDRVRITAQLIDTRSDKHLWAQSFEGQSSDILSLQDSVASEIASQARVVLMPAARPHGPGINPAAHDAYLRGRYFFQKDDFLHSAAYFQQAIAMEPSYASAYAGYAEALDAGTTFGLGRPEDVMPKAIAAAQHAIELDPQNGEAYTALGSIQTIYEWDWPAAEHNLTRGIALSPSYSLAEMKYAVYLDAVGRPQDALTHMRRALELDPLSFFMTRRLGATLYLARQYDEALAQFQRASEMEPAHPVSYDEYLSLIYEKKGMHDQAVDNDLAALHDNSLHIDTVALRAIYKREGWDAYWRAHIQALLPYENHECMSYSIGTDFLRLGDRDRAFSSFNRAIDQHCFWMAWAKVDPLLDGVRDDPRYPALLRRLHLPS